MNILKALVKREILDGKNGYLRVPVVLAGITVALLALSALGFGNMIEFHGMEGGTMHREGIENLGDAVTRLHEKEPENAPAAIAVGYWGMSALAWMAFPFVVFFSLLGALYEERRDKSILFWKSMPVADWQEVAVKLFVPVIVAPLVFLGVTIAAQIIIAFFLSVVVLFEGGPVLVMWPLGYMMGSWLAGISMYLIYAMWALPVFAWILLVSAFSNRMPFMWAVLLPGVAIAMENLFLDTNVVGSWIGMHVGGWMEFAFAGHHKDINGPRDLLVELLGGPQLEALGYSVTSLHFWAGLVVAGGIVYATIEKRKRAI
tara:strand:+ start:1521 stop:2468 length:948 start_codon:yes stop_codon:yes gene_type:complete